MEKPSVPSIEDTIKKLEEALKSFEEAGIDREKDEQAKKVYMSLYTELIRMKKNLQTLKGNLS